MTAFKTLVFGVLVWTLLEASASAAPMSSWTPGAWAWWSDSSSPTASLWGSDQPDTSLYGPQTIVAASTAASASDTATSSSSVPAVTNRPRPTSPQGELSFPPGSASRP